MKWIVRSLVVGWEVFKAWRERKKVAANVKQLQAEADRKLEELEAEQWRKIEAETGVKRPKKP